MIEIPSTEYSLTGASLSNPLLHIPFAEAYLFFFFFLFGFVGYILYTPHAFCCCFWTIHISIMTTAIKLLVIDGSRCDDQHNRLETGVYY